MKSMRWCKGILQTIMMQSQPFNLRLKMSEIKNAEHLSRKDRETL